MPRPPYSSLPTAVRRWVEATLGSPVVTAQSQPGGFSPGVAARLGCASGRRAFVKAVSGLVNPDTPAMHREEARLTALLPSTVGAPALLSSYDDGEEVALLFDEVAGRPPRNPWVEAELAAALRALDRLGEVNAPDGFPAAADRLSGTFGRWERMAADPPTDLDPWQRRHLDDLVQLEAGWESAVHGDRLLHIDVRSDNLLIRESGEAVLVDWPHAGCGAPVLDVIGFLPSAALEGAGSPESLLQLTVAGRQASEADVTTLVVALSGYFESSCRKPPPPGIPDVRAFQAAQAGVARDWVRQRTGW